MPSLKDQNICARCKTAEREVQSYCKPCRSEIRRISKQKNYHKYDKEEISEKKKEYYIANKERINKQQKEYYHEKHKEAKLEKENKKKLEEEKKKLEEEERQKKEIQKENVYNMYISKFQKGK